MVWAGPKQAGDVPVKRSGHSFTLKNNENETSVYLFGGCDHKAPPGPTNDLYRLDVAGGASLMLTLRARCDSVHSWAAVTPRQERIPGPRSFHWETLQALTTLPPHPLHAGDTLPCFTANYSLSSAALRLRSA